MPEKQKPIRKLRAILSADVKGYSRLMEKDEASTIQRLNEYRSTMSKFVKQHFGRVVDAVGDNLLAEFSSAVDAVQCAVDIQKDLKKKNSELPEESRLRFRIGINIGDVVQEGDRIYGSGVNVASRLEGLADPGGISISRNTYDHIKEKLNLGYQYLGVHEVKNIKDPVHVYKVLMDSKDAGKVIGEKLKFSTRKWGLYAVIALTVVFSIMGYQIYQQMTAPEFEPASIERMAYKLPDKPSIAVLAFDNMSGDPAQEFFSDGISESIIATLSKIGQLFVVARNSSFTYKGKPVKVQKIAEDLGVRYVLEGSVQKTEDRVRITAQLIDAVEGNHVWSERYDGNLTDIFNLQDEIVRKIVTALQIKLSQGEEIRYQMKEFTNFHAYLKYLEAISEYVKGTQESQLRLSQLAQEIIDLEPESPVGYRLLGVYYHDLAVKGFSFRENLKKAFSLAQKALSMDENNSYSHTLMCLIYTAMRQHEKAVAAGKKAVELQPSNGTANMRLANALCYAEEYDQAIIQCKQGIRLNPLPTVYHFTILGQCYYTDGQYEKALTELKKAVKLSPDNGVTHLRLALVYGLLDRKEDAQASAKKALEIYPNWSVSSLKKNWKYKTKNNLPKFIDALRKAGFPE